MHVVSRTTVFLLGLFLMSGTASAQKHGGILRVYHRDSPASMSIYEETTISTLMPTMGVFNNLVVFDPQKPQNRLDNIVPDLAEAWKWNDSGRELTFTLRRNIKWHDGNAFTANDVKCSWDLLTGKAKEKLRLNARERIVTLNNHSGKPLGGTGRKPLIYCLSMQPILALES